MNSALTTNVLCLVVLVFGFLLCYSATLHIGSHIGGSKMPEKWPGPDAPEAEIQRWIEQQQPYREAGHATAKAFVWIAVGFVGVPIGLLLLYNIVVLSRLKSGLLPFE